MSSLSSTEQKDIDTRINSIRELVAEYVEKINKLSTDEAFKLYYTNREIEKRYREENNSSLSPPLLLRTFRRNLYNNNYVDFLEASKNLNNEFSKKLNPLSTFSINQLKYIVDNMKGLLVYNQKNTDIQPTWIPIHTLIDEDISLLSYDGAFYINRLFRDDKRIDLSDRDMDEKQVFSTLVYLDTSKCL